MIEVEKKFLIDDEKIRKITRDSVFIDEKKLIDIYHDYKDYGLTTKDHWLRNRNSKFELKISVQDQRGSTDQYREIDNEKEICQYLKIKLLDSLSESLTKNQINPFARIVSQRKKYKKGQFTLDFDITDFGYSICEIELLVKSKSDIGVATKKIEDFVTENYLDNRPVRGKLIEYIYHNSPRHYQALVEAGIIKN